VKDGFSATGNLLGPVAESAYDFEVGMAELESVRKS
jgi:hypothetical protein